MSSRDPDGRDEALGRTATAPSAARRTDPADQSGRALAAGDRLGRYTILDLLGEGGMGVVYGAYDPALDRKVALKLLRTGAAGDLDRARLLREARSMARLSHPNVITVYEVGTVGRTDFVAMEFVDGGTVAEWLRAEPRPWAEVLEVFRQIGRGLAAAHAAGLVHRDLKPANVLMGSDGRVMVTDFGLARLEDEIEGTNRARDDAPVESAATASPSLTHTGALVGTPAYMAPEQHEGGGAGARSDQFSYCVALWEGLYGQRPFGGDTLGELRAAAAAGPPARPLSEVPDEVHQVLERGLSIDPEARYPSIDALLAELAARPQQASRRRLLAIVAAASVALIGLGAVLAATTRGSAPDALCGDDARSLAGVWDEPARAGLRSGFAAAGAGDLFARLGEALDAYGTEWSATHQAVCAARDQRGFHPAMACLADRRAELEAYVDVLTGADRDLAEQSVEMLEDFLDPTACNTERARSAPPPPSDPALRRAVQEVRAELARARALRRAQSREAAAALADAALASARQLEYPPLVAEALMMVGSARVGQGRIAEARDSLEHAIILAEEHAHDEIRARALVELAELTASFSSDRGAGHESVRQARAAVRRWGDEVLEADLDLLLGRLAADDGQLDEAERLLEGARAVYEGAGERLELATALLQLGGVQMERGRWEPSIELIGRAARLTEDTLGADHPRTVGVRESEARMLSLVGRFDEAAAILSATRAFWSTERGRELLAADDDDDPGELRQISGRVVTAEGEPVAGVEVIAGPMLGGDGMHAAANLGGRSERAWHIVRTSTAGDGSYVLEGVPAKPVVVIADGGERGRSAPARVGASAGGAFELALRPYGGVRGQVDGRAVIVTMMPVELGGSVNYSLVAAVDHRGRFELARLPRGDYWLTTSMTANPGRASSRASVERVQVEAGVTAELVVAAPSAAEGGVTVTIDVRGVDPRRSSVQALLLRGYFESTTVREFNDTIMGQSPTLLAGLLEPPADGPSERGVPRGRIRFEGVAPGQVSVCLVPIGGDIKDPEYLESIGEPDDLPVQCTRHDLPAEPAEQLLELSLPPPSGE